MAENINQASVPKADGLDYSLGFDAAGNWAKAKPVTASDLSAVSAVAQAAKEAADAASEQVAGAVSTANGAASAAEQAKTLAGNADKNATQRADTDTGKSGRVTSNLVHFTNPSSPTPDDMSLDKGGGLYYVDGVAWPTMRLLKECHLVVDIWDNRSKTIPSQGSNIIWELAGQYGAGWHSEGEAEYVGCYLLVTSIAMIGFDGSDGSIWAFSGDKWKSATATQAETIKAQIAAVKTTAETMAGATPGRAVSVPSMSNQVNSIAAPNIVFENGLGGTFAPPLTTGVNLSGFIKSAAQQLRWGAYTLSGIYSGTWTSGDITLNGILLVFPLGIGLFVGLARTSTYAVYVHMNGAWGRLSVVASTAAAALAFEEAGVDAAAPEPAAADEPAVAEKAEEGGGDE